MKETYKAWVMMDSENGVISEEYETPDAVLAEMQQKYTIEEMHENGFTLDLLLCTDQQWLECLDEIEY